ncbi:Hypothetical protein SMB2099_4326 [Serratia marcescens SMB2099]|nr:Hypothetical protein SMB2099_4326 [Serratia marcescens SMB2099]
MPSSGLTRIDIFHSNTLRLENKNDALSDCSLFDCDYDLFSCDRR